MKRSLTECVTHRTNAGPEQTAHSRSAAPPQVHRMLLSLCHCPEHLHRVIESWVHKKNTKSTTATTTVEMKWLFYPAVAAKKQNREKVFPIKKKIGILLFCCYSAAAFLFLGSSRRICFVCSPYVRFIHALWWIRSFFEHILSYPLVGFRFDLLNCVARMDWSKHRGKHGVLCKQRLRTHTVAHRSSSISETSAISFAINVLS